MSRFPSTTLSDQQIKRYRQDGFTTLPGVLDARRIQALRDECRRLWNRLASDGTSHRLQRRRTVNGEAVADRIDPVLDISPFLQGIAHDKTIVRPVSDLVRAGPPEIFKAKVISKWPQTLGYTMHQDYSY